MALASMTGFARSHGISGSYAWAWELKSVNAKGLDLRLRLPQGWDAVDAPARSRAAEVLARGTVYGTLTVERQGLAPVVRINEPVLEAALGTIRALAGRLEADPPRLDGILALKGVIEVTEQDEREEDRRAAEADVIAGFQAALTALAEMRRREGTTLGQVLSQRIEEIAALAARAEPRRAGAEAIKARIAEQVALLLDAVRFDPDRLHPGGDPHREQGRYPRGARPARFPCRPGHAVDQAGRLDRSPAGFSPAQGTQPQIQHALRHKSNDVELTKLGLELKTVVEQFREQVQNLE